MRYYWESVNFSGPNGSLDVVDLDRRNYKVLGIDYDNEKKKINFSVTHVPSGLTANFIGKSKTPENERDLVILSADSRIIGQTIQTINDLNIQGE